MKAAPFILFSMLAVGCSLPFDSSPITPAQSRKTTKESKETFGERPAPSSPFIGSRFYFDGGLPEEWRITLRGGHQSPMPGYAALCVVSHRNGQDKVLFLLASEFGQGEHADMAMHQGDADWWRSRVPQSFFDFDRADANTRMHVGTGQLAGNNSLLIFAVLRCEQATCENSLAQSRDFTSRLHMRPVRADDEHVVSPTAYDCGTRF